MQNTETVKISAPKKRKSQAREIWRRFKKNKSAVIGLAIISVIALLAIFADLIANYNGVALKQNADQILQFPSLKHLFGTDSYGRDIFARVIYGARVSLTIGLLSTLISTVLGSIFGAVAGFYGGKIDGLIMRIMDTIICIPAVLLALAIIAALGPGLTNMMIAITIASVPTFTRVVRSVILTIVGQDYIEAAKAGGASDIRIIVFHILPNAMGPIIIQATMSIAGMIIAAASLSYLGMGIQPPRPEWGAMLSEAAVYMVQYPYVVIIPGLALVLTAMSVNLIGDGLRDALDPKLKN